MNGRTHIYVSRKKKKTSAGHQTGSIDDICTKKTGPQEFGGECGMS